MHKEQLLNDFNFREQLWPAIDCLIHVRYSQLLDAVSDAGDLAVIASEACRMYEEQCDSDIIAFVMEECGSRCGEASKTIGLLTELGSTIIDEWLAMTFIKMAVERMYEEAIDAYEFINGKAEELIAILSSLEPKATETGMHPCPKPLQ